MFIPYSNALFSMFNGNYLDSEAGSRDSLWDFIGDKITEHKEEFINGLINFLCDIWDFLIVLTDKLSFWVTCMLCIYNIWIYAITHDKKHGTNIAKLFVTYIFIKMIVSVLS